MRLMLRPPQHVDIVPERLGPLDEHVAGFFGGFGRPRQNPQVSAGRFANYRPRIIRGVVKDPVITVERAEERHL